MDNDFLMNTGILLTLAGAIYYFVNNPELFLKRELNEINGEGFAESGPNSPLASIFYLYNHESEKHWGRWIKQQNDDAQREAAQLLINHLNDEAKYWGIVTLEVIEALRQFKNYNVERPLAEFFIKTGKLWHEYKSCPNYYEKAMDVMAEINPITAKELINNEFEKAGNSQIGMEKKRILTGLLPKLERVALDLMVNLLTNNQESFSSRSYTLKILDAFDPIVRADILLMTLTIIIQRNKKTLSDMKTEESLFIQDLMEKSVEKLGDIKFYKQLNLASKNPRLKMLVINPLIQYLTNAHKEPSKQELFHALHIEDSENHDLRRALAKRHQLELPETNNIVLEAVAPFITRELLFNIDNKELEFPIPEILEYQYESFKNLFFRNNEHQEYVTSEKIFGGVLITGNEDIEKLFFSRALAKEKNWNFAIIDIQKIDSKENYGTAIKIFNELRKPYLLYLLNPEAFYSKTSVEADVQKGKFAQALSIQAMDNKSYLTGDISVSMTKATGSDLGEKIKLLRSKFFPQAIEFNKTADVQKYKILEEFLKYISTHRFENRKDLCTELYDNGKELNNLNFIFFVIKTLTAMLIIFGKDVPYKEIKNLDDEFRNNLQEINEAQEEQS